VVLTVSSVLSPVSGLVVTVAGAMRKHRRRLDASVAASGPHGFAVRVDALRPAHRPRPSHPAPNVPWRSRYAPPGGRETREEEPLICPTAKAENFCAKGWTLQARPKAVICPSGKSLQGNQRHARPGFQGSQAL